MFLKTRKKGNKTYLSLVESYWSNGVSKHRTIASLGSIDSYSREQLLSIGTKLMAYAGVIDGFIDLEGMEELRRFNWGCLAIGRKLWEDFDFDCLLVRLKARTKIKYPLEETVFKIVSTRLSEPMSKLKLFESQDRYAGAKEVDLQHIYRSLNFLADHKDEIERHIYEINRNFFNMSVDIVFYDVTTLYFESVRPDALKNFGYSKDCKFGEVQVVLGMIMNGEGRPVGFEIFPGNTFEGNTLSTALLKLKNRFQIDRVIVVADRGMNSKINLKTIRDLGFHYIVGSRLRTLPAKHVKDILSIDSYKTTATDDDGTPIFKVKEVEYLNKVTVEQEDGRKQQHELKERMICSWSAERAKKDSSDRERLVKKAASLVSTPSKLNDKRGAKKYVKQLGSDSPEELALDIEKIDADARWDGFYGIQTSDQTLQHTEIMNAYKNLWRIEEIFRTLKSTLEMRPMFHWTPDRIRGHMVACFISFVFERTIELKVIEEKKIHLSPDRIQIAL